MWRAEPLGATCIPILSPQEKPATSPIKPPSTDYAHPPSDLEQSSCIHVSSLILYTQSPWRCQWETRKDCFLIAGKRKRGEGLWNIEQRCSLTGTRRFCFVLYLMLVNFWGTPVFHLNHRDVTVDVNKPWLHAWLFPDRRKPWECLHGICSWSESNLCSELLFYSKRFFYLLNS